MLIIQRIYIKELLKVLGIVGFGLSFIFALIGLIDKVDNFMPYNPPFSLLVQYLLFSIPRYLQYLLPMAILLSSLFVFSMAQKRGEIIAIKASAGKLKRLLLPFVIIGVTLVLLGFIISEILVPFSSKKNVSITDRIINKKRETVFKEGVLYLKGIDGSIIRIGMYVPASEVSKNISIYKLSDDGLMERIDAENALWQGNLWRLTGVTVYDFKKGIVRRTSEMYYNGIPSLEVFRSEAWKIEEMSTVELIRYNRRLKEAGFKNTKILVDINARLSYSMINLFMLLLGIAFSLTHNLSDQRLFKILPAQKIKSSAIGGGIVTAGVGLLISLVYWFGYSFFLSLGYAGAIPPLIAPWIVPVTFGAISFYIYSQIPE